jgi:hypothetical protein
MQQMGLLRADNSMTDFGRAVATLFQGFKFEPISADPTKTVVLSTPVVVNNTTNHVSKGKRKFRTRVHHKFLSPEEVAKKLVIPVGTLNVWRSRRVGPNFVRIGDEIFYREIDVRDWIKGGADTKRQSPVQPVIDELNQVLGIKR